MSTFEPAVVLQVLKARLPVKEQKEFATQWKYEISERVQNWANHPTRKKCPRSPAQLEWEAAIVQYVNFIQEATRARSKKFAVPPPRLGNEIPLLGPRFLPPSYLHVRKRPGNPLIEPEVMYIRALNVVHPFYYPSLARCPQCYGTNIVWEGWTGTGARDVHGVKLEEAALGCQLRCKDCKGARQENRNSQMALDESGIQDDEETEQGAGGGYCFATTNVSFWVKSEHWQIPREIPHFLRRCAVTRDLYDLIVELRPSLTSAGLAEHIRQLHLLEYHHRMLDYVTNFQQVKAERGGMEFFQPSTLRLFSPPDDATGYGNKSISDKIITEVFIDFVQRTREQEAAEYLRSTTAITLSFENTYRAASKATLTDKDGKKARPMKGGILSALNERNEIISWRLCQTQANGEIEELLGGIRERCNALGVQGPEMVVVDNCCHVRRAIERALPNAKAVLDVWHFIMRYIATIVSSKQTAYRARVAEEISSCVLKSRAENGQLAQYWDRHEQESRLERTFAKWAAEGVWSAAGQKVHLEQLKHVRKGCLERTRNDVRSDGSRIEASHKGWNSLQRVQPSGIAMFVALCHDFVLRRNVRITFQAKQSTQACDRFVHFARGSHHLHLVNQSAQQWNVARSEAKQTSLARLPEFPTPAPINERFGLVGSQHVTTFGGLLSGDDVKDEPTMDLDICPSHSGDEAEQAMNSLISRTTELLINEYGIEEALFNVQLKGSVRLQSTPDTEDSRSLPLDTSAAQSATDRERNMNHPVMDLTVEDSDHQDSASFSTPPPSPSKRKASPLNSASPTDAHACKRVRDAVSAPITNFSQACPFPNMASHHFASMPSPRPTPAPEPSTQVITTSNTNQPSSNPSEQPDDSNLTRSQQLFGVATGIDVRALQIMESHEFHLFMDMRAEKVWQSFSMTPKGWVSAANEYNTRLQKLCMEKALPQPVNKNPLALLRKLGEIEPQLINRLLSNNFASSSGNTSFWTRHCQAVPLATKPSPDSKRKPATCKRCLTLMYPGPPRSRENHRRNCCADGVKQQPTSPGEPLPPWPQPRGIFTDGRYFHPRAFLDCVQKAFEFLIIRPSSTVTALPLDTSLLELESFTRMLAERCTVLDDGSTLFRLYNGFVIDSSWPKTRLQEHEGGEWLPIDYLSNRSQGN